MGGGAPLSIFESGAIMTYLAEKTGRFCPADPRGKYDVAQWVSWQLANQGPKLGEQGHFRRALASGTNGDLSYALRRFDNEAHCIYGVMNLGLFNQRYLAAGQYRIADMICYPGPRAGRHAGSTSTKSPSEALARRNRRAAGVKKAMAMGPEFREDPASISSEEQARRRKLVADQRAQPIPAEWLQAGKASVGRSQPARRPAAQASCPRAAPPIAWPGDEWCCSLIAKWRSARGFRGHGALIRFPIRQSFCPVWRLSPKIAGHLAGDRSSSFCRTEFASYLPDCAR